MENMSIRIVQIGRMVHEIKGQHILLKALHKLIITEKYSHIYLDFIGTGPSLPYLQTLTNTLQLSDHVFFLGEKVVPGYTNSFPLIIFSFSHRCWKDLANSTGGNSRRFTRYCF